VTHLDVRRDLCPNPALPAEEALHPLHPGDHLEILGDDPVMTIDIPAWCDDKGHTLLSCETRDGEVHCLVRREGADQS
jgi:tRNA 2-thiouridine synthesizing protein A